MGVQSVLIPRETFTLEEATKWLEEHKFRLLKVDITDHYFRFRQLPPSRSSYYTKALPDGIKLVVEARMPPSY